MHLLPPLFRLRPVALLALGGLLFLSACSKGEAIKVNCFASDQTALTPSVTLSTRGTVDAALPAPCHFRSLHHAG